jgi:hypothetical protein
LEEHHLTYLVLPLHKEDENIITLRQLNSFKVFKVIIFAATFAVAQLHWWQKQMRTLPQIEWFFYDHRLEYGLNENFFPDNCSAVGFDRLAAFRKLVSHTASRGYRNFCYRAPFYTDEATIAAAEKENIQLIGIESQDSLEIFAEEVKKILFTGPPTALCIPDDLQTIKLIKLLEEQDIAVPRDAGVISWDGLPVSTYFSPVPETLAVPHDEMCRAAGNFLAGKGGGFRELSPEIRPGTTLPPR